MHNLNVSQKMCAGKSENDDERQKRELEKIMLERSRCEMCVLCRIER